MRAFCLSKTLTWQDVDGQVKPTAVRFSLQRQNESQESLGGAGSLLRILAGRGNTAEFLNFGSQHIPLRLARLRR